MLLQLSAQFDPAKEVAPWLAAADPAEKNSETLHVVNVERNGNIIYTWKGTHAHTCIGLYDPNSQKNEHLYTFEQDLHVISCSVNHEKTLLASRCRTLLIEIHPVNNVKVLKATDSCVTVQFLYPVAEPNALPESHLLLISEDKYIEKFDIRVVKEEHKVMIENSSPLPKKRIADDFIWAQWDMMEQRLFYIIPKESGDTLSCVQFYPDKNFKLILEAPLDFSLDDIGFKLVNLDYYCCQDQEIVPKPLNLQVFTSETGSFCICYRLATIRLEEVMYSVSFLHKGYSKTYTVALGRADSLQLNDVAFLNLDYYVAIYLPGNFLHLLNTRHPDLMCYNFFLTGEDSKISGLPSSSVMSPFKTVAFDRSTGRLFHLGINKEVLLQFLWNSKVDSDRLAALHCILLHIGSMVELEIQEIIQWVSENLSNCSTFDPIQEFIIASLYWRMSPQAVNLDKLLPYSALQCWNEIVPGLSCTTQIISLPVLKAQNCKGFWEKLISRLEYVKYAEPHLCFNSKVLKSEWDKLLLEEKTDNRRTTTAMKNIFENTKKVLSRLKAWNKEERLVPLFQDEDYQQQLLIGLMVSQLKDHLMRHLQYVGKKKIDQIAVDYVSNLLDLICRIMEVAWRKYNLDSSVLSLGQKGSPEEMVVFHIMCQILQAANGMCAPLPPGFCSLHMRLGVRCLPLHTLLHHIDHGVLHLTETFVMKLLKELDSTDKNEELKLSVLTRLPETVSHKAGQLWNHHVRSNAVARSYVRLLLEQLRNKQQRVSVLDSLSSHTEFLPLNYLVSLLAEVERQGWQVSVEQPDNVDARFIGEFALKHTSELLGL